jgi:hypothetical protein
LYTDEIIQILNEKFVPFAPSWGGSQGKYPWFKEVQKKYAQGKGEGGLHTTLLWMTSSAGTLVTGKTKEGHVANLKAALAEYAKLPEEKRIAKIDDPLMPCPSPPAGGAVLTVYDRALARNDDGSCRCRAPKRDDEEMAIKGAPGHSRPEWFAQRNSLWLSKDDVASLMPANPQKGQTYDVPTNLTKRLAILGLWPQTIWVVEQRWDPDCFRAGKLKLTIEEVAPRSVQLRIHGDVLLESPARFGKLNGKSTGPLPEEAAKLNNRYDGRLEGRIAYDPSQGKLTRFDMVGLGDYTGVWVGYRADGWRGWAINPVPFGFSFELDPTDYEVTAERRRPGSFQFNYVFKGREPAYWDPDVWLQEWSKQKR